MQTIAVIGAGFSGTLLSLHLLGQCPPTTRLVLIERNSQFGRGLAYATPNASHILNVPAARMSAFHDRPTDFLDWLTRQPADHDGTPPGPLPIADPGFYDTEFYRPDPWAPDALTGLDPDAAVLLGTGLTTMDLVIALLDQQHRGPIVALSRRGLLPRRHEGVPLPAPEHAPYPTAVNALTRFLRREAARATAEGSGWQPVIDELRPFTVDVWQAMPPSDRKRFLRHLRPWWDVHRHRMAAQVADRIDAARAAGQLRILVGRLRELAVRDGEVAARYGPQRQEATQTIMVSRVVNCAKPGADYDRIEEPLIRAMLRDRLVRPDPLRLGLDVTGNCVLLNAQGRFPAGCSRWGRSPRGRFGR